MDKTGIPLDLLPSDMLRRGWTQGENAVWGDAVYNDYEAYMYTPLNAVCMLGATENSMETGRLSWERRINDWIRDQYTTHRFRDGSPAGYVRTVYVPDINDCLLPFDVYGQAAAAALLERAEYAVGLRPLKR